MSRTPPDLDALTAPQRLLPLLAQLVAPSVVGFEPTTEGLGIHVAPLPGDERAAAAGLFGLRARPTWTATGVVLTGRLRSTDAPPTAAGRVRLAIVVREDATHAHRIDPLDPDDAAAAPPACCGPDAAPPEGLLIDALLRMLGRPSATPAPAPHETSLVEWAHGIVTTVLDGSVPDWDEVVDLHPGLPGGEGGVPPSLEAMVEATHRAGARVDWEAIHRRAASGNGPLPPDLARHEAEWMDAPMYARWALGALADPDTASMVLRANGAGDAARRFEQVCASVSAGRGAGDGRNSSRMADG